MKTFENIYDLIISSESLFIAWKRFSIDKRKKKDVLQFEWSLEQNIFKLHRDLRSNKYKHGPYTGFYITDPKQRHIHKAIVQDRVLHHSIFQTLNPIFEPTFISNSFSCRVGKGTHKGVLMVEKMIRKVSKNYTHPCYVLKCDIKKFFNSVDHKILIEIIEQRVKDKKAMWLIREVISSYPS